jgi:hypothetical protein
MIASQTIARDMFFVCAVFFRRVLSWCVRRIDRCVSPVDRRLRCANGSIPSSSHCAPHEENTHTRTRNRSAAAR